MPEVPHDDSADIVGRDQNGRLKVQMPVLPALEDEKAQAQGEGGGDAGADGVSKDSKSSLFAFPGPDRDGGGTTGRG